MAIPPLLVDEMLGRLARYLRFLGIDAAYERGLSDTELLAFARERGRRLVTRDRALAGRSGEIVLLRDLTIGGQIREFRAFFPNLRLRLTFDRCSLCNGPLTQFAPAELSQVPEYVPSNAATQELTLYRCRQCRHVYWEGSHTRRIRESLRRWLGEEVE